MPQLVEQTVQTPMWPCKTREQMDEAAWELMDDFNVAANTFRQPTSVAGEPRVFLQVITAGQQIISCSFGNTLVFMQGEYREMTDEQLVSAGLPIPDVG